MLNIEATYTALGAATAEAEIDLLAAVYCDPRGMVPVAEAAGIRPYHFGQEDLRLLWCACEVAGPRFGLPGVRRLARRALADVGLWCDRGPIYLGPPWSERSLDLLAGSYFPCRPIVRQRAERLIDLALLARETHALMRRVAAAVEARPSPAPAVPHVARAPRQFLVINAATGKERAA